MSNWATFNQCCCCVTGAIIPRWKNVTGVRVQTDCADPTTKATAVANGSTIPAARLDNTYDAGSGGAGACSGGTKCGLCGGWLTIGDFGGLPAQEVTDGTDDIVAGAAADATHYSLDHNSYQSYPNAAASFFQVGDIAKIVSLGSTDWAAMGAMGTPAVGLIFTVTVVGSGSGTAQLMTDMLMARRRGGMWILAQHFWSGTFGLFDYPNTDVTVAPVQVKYLKVDATASYYHFNYERTYPIGLIPTPTTTPLTSITIQTDTAAGEVVRTVNAKSRIITQSLPTPPNETQVGVTNDTLSCADGPIVSQDLTFFPTPNLDIPTISGLVGNNGQTALSSIASVNSDGTGWTATGSTPPGIQNYYADITVTRSNTEYVWSFDLWDFAEVSGSPGTWEVDHVTYTGSIKLSNAYGSADCCTDFKLLLNGWDTSDFNLASLRFDENLAHSALCTFAGVPAAVSPIGLNCSMDDYTQPQNMDTTWPQRAWLDPNDYFWRNSAGGVNGVMDAAGGNILVTPLYSGDIIAHTRAGSDRHFWFNAVTYRREEIIIDGNPTGQFQWNAYSHGAYSDSQLPTPTMRWMPPQNEQYDGAAAGTPPIGNFPQQFTDFSNGCLKGGKYVQAVQKWNAVDFLQPCAARKFDIDQTTVGVITSAGGGFFTVGKPTTTAAFPSTGYIAVTGSIGVTGIYPVTGAATDNGDHTWNVPVGAKIDDLPTGGIVYDDLRDDSDWLGWLKWISYTQYAHSFGSAPGIRGRVAVTTGYAAGVLAVTTTAAQPYFRVDPASGALRSVNLYDVSGTLLNGSPLVLARTDDSHFTATTTNYPTAVWMVDAALTWAQSQFTTASQNTGVHIQWGFDKRKAALATGSQPKWLGGVVAGDGLGTVGCLDASYSIEQFNYPVSSCPAIVGILPAGSPENFTPQVLFDFPPTVIDSAYGSHSQSFIGLTMEDQIELACGSPWKPDFNPMDFTTHLAFVWREDNGAGNADDPAATPPVYYFSLRPMVEALSAVPSGKSLPTGVTLFFDPANKFSPPNYPNGIPLGASVMSDWATADRMCAATRWAAIYATFNDATTCP